MLEKQILLQQAQRYDSFYLYDEKCIISQAQLLQQCFAGVGFLYSVKANPHPLVLQSIFAQRLGADAASLNEVLLCRKLGLPAGNIYYSAPGKTARDIAGALGQCVLIADSLHEIALIDAAAQKAGVVAAIGVRINPNFTFYAENGAPSKFGVDEQLLLDNLPVLQSLAHTRIIGIHVHAGSQKLHADILLHYYENMLGLADRVEEMLNRPLAFINMGSGIGIAYAPRQQSLDIPSLGNAAGALFGAYRAQHPDTAILIETGRFVTCNCGVYAAKVLDKKTSFGKPFVLLSNTLNGFVKPALSQILQERAPASAPAEPLYTGPDAHSLIVLNDETEQERITLTGNLCTAMDAIAKDILLPRLHIGDVVATTNAGSYAAAISPMQFASLEPPAELFLTADGQVLNYAHR